MVTKSSVKYKERWSEAEFAIVLDLYFQTNPKERHKENKRIVEVARIIGRTPASIIYRLGNYSAIDPNSEVKGFSHGGPETKSMFNKYSIEKDPLKELAKKIRT